jgi:hypothetical protein
MDSTSDPLFEAFLDDWVNEAGNGIILRALDKSQYKYGLFVELEDEWIIDSTTNGVVYISMPSDCLVLTGLYSFDDASGSTVAQDRKVITRTTNRKYQTMAKTQVGWPRVYVRYGNQIRLHPTPSTAYLTQTLATGLARENVLSGNTDTFIMDPVWHPVVVDYATYLGANFLGWVEEAGIALSACDQKLISAISVKAYELQNLNLPRKIKGDPTRGLY